MAVLSAQNRVVSCWSGGIESEATAGALPVFVSHLSPGEHFWLTAQYLSSYSGKENAIWSVKSEISLPIGSLDVLFGSSLAWVTEEQCLDLGLNYELGECWTVRLAGGICRFVCPDESPYIAGVVQAGGYYRPTAHFLCFVETDNLTLSRCRGLNFPAEYAVGTQYEVSEHLSFAGKISKQLRQAVSLHLGMTETWPLSDHFCVSLMTGVRYPNIRPSFGMQLRYKSLSFLSCLVWDLNLGPASGMSFSLAI